MRGKSPGSANRDQKWIKAGVLALLVHVVFFIFMTFGLSWKTNPPEGIVVDLWSDLPQPEQKPTKKIKAQPPKPAPSKKIKPVPPKKVKVAPPKKVKVAPPKKVESLPSKAEIELKKEKEKKEKERKVRLAKEKKEKEKKARLAKEKKEKERKARLAKEKKEKERKARLAKEKKEKERKVRLAKEKKEKERKIKEQNARVAAETERFQKELREEEERRRLQKLAYAKAAAKRNLIDEYKAKILAKIKSKLVLPPDLPNDPVAEYNITLLPGGEILSVKLRNSSGFRSFDEAVERAIILARPLPLPRDKLLFPNFRDLGVKVHYLDD
ncbi:cell envelope integrity protein TolA [Nitrosomonadaceae bacterium]|nr:cell envelope integrity protein TolA [Nitrosomonadaceae bacterium]